MEWFLWSIVQFEPQDMILESAIILKNSCSWYSSLGTENEQETLQNPRCFHSGWASLMAQMVKNPPAMQETWIWSLRWEDPFSLEGMGFLFLFFFCFVLWPHHTAWGILVFWPGIEPCAPCIPTLESGNLNYWITREVPRGWVLMGPGLRRSPLPLLSYSWHIFRVLGATIPSRGIWRPSINSSQEHPCMFPKAVMLSDIKHIGAKAQCEG